MATISRIGDQLPRPAEGFQLVWNAPQRHSQSGEPRLLRPAHSCRPDDVFDALDGREIVADRAIWRLQVYSVSDYDGGRWIQLGLLRPGTCRMRTVRVTSDDQPEHILVALQSLLRDDDGNVPDDAA
jgi:hypothetical protein